MKEKPCSMEVPSIRKCFPGGMLVMVRLMLAGPAGCMPKGSTSHSSSSTKSFWGTGLGHQGNPRLVRGHKGLAACLPHITGLL